MLHLVPSLFVSREVPFWCGWLFLSCLLLVGGCNGSVSGSVGPCSDRRAWAVCQYVHMPPMGGDSARHLQLNTLAAVLASRKRLLLM